MKLTAALLVFMATFVASLPTSKTAIISVLALSMERLNTIGDCSPLTIEIYVHGQDCYLGTA